MAGGPGFEPRMPGSEPGVLPLNYPPSNIANGRGALPWACGARNPVTPRKSFLPFPISGREHSPVATQAPMVHAAHIEPVPPIPPIPPTEARDRSLPPAFAALDLGTNNCRLLVGTPAGEGFRVLD